ncbi:MAG: hypothetical protein M4579_003057 [Chaenotheca gracillima]|nr:MAG: hypothetical protein M4579_003057 [Chaenotheca gracillima]
MALRSLATLFFILAVVKPIIAGYALSDNFSGKSFFSAFNFFTGPDPTQGFVQYADLKTAAENGLIGASHNQVYLGVDKTNVAPQGRQSIRLTSQKSYNQGLFIADIKHMPGSICGTWPAFWLVGPSWPNDGEIDIIEGVNDQVGNEMTLHTGPGCSVGDSGYTGKGGTKNCDTNAQGQDKNAGCQISNGNSSSYGTGFNNNGGGVYATEWTSQAIKIWFFPRHHIPRDIRSGHPNPGDWGLPTAQFSGQCDMDARFKDLQIVFDTTFCGSWAGQVWDTSKSCKAQPHGDTCNDYVANNPSAFREAYWEINYVKVFQNHGQSKDKLKHIRSHSKRHMGSRAGLEILPS